MQIYKNFILSIFLLFVMLPLSSCSTIQPSIEKLIKAPELTGEYYEIKQTLESELGNGVMLRYPKSGDYRSAIIMNDVDNDGQEEAIVFYSQNDDANSEIKFSVLDKINGKWVNIFSTVAPGVDVEKVLISNLMGLANNQIIINWVKANGVDRALQVYNYENNKFNCIYTKDFLTDVFVFDIDNDLLDELVIIDRTLKTTPNVKIVKKVDNVNELDVVSYTRLREGPICYKKVTVGKLCNNVNALFLDAESEDQGYEDKALYTEVVVLTQDYKLLNLFYAKNNSYELNQYLLNETLRFQDVFCRDVDGDSIIEIPQRLHYKYKYAGKHKVRVKPLIIWKKYINGNWNFSNVSFENKKDGYSFLFPLNWLKLNNSSSSEVTSVKDEIEPLVLAFEGENQNEIFFRNNNETKQEVMAIKVAESTEQVGEGYLTICRKNNFVYYVKINNKNKNFPITLKQVKKYFSIIYGG